MTRQAPDWERNIMNYGPTAHTSLASWPPSGFTWNSCSQPKLVRASSHAPASSDANTRVKEPDAATRCCPGHLKTEKKNIYKKKPSVLTFRGGALKIFTVWRLNFRPLRPVRCFGSLAGHLLGLTRNCKVGALLGWLKEIGGGNFRNISEMLDSGWPLRSV